MRSVYTKPVSIHRLYKIIGGFQSLTVGNFIDVYCIVYTLSIHRYISPFPVSEALVKTSIQCIDGGVSA